MKEIKQRKERRFLKTLGKVGEILIQEVLLKLGSSLIKKIGGKKPLPSILFLFLSFTLFAQYPATGNKQRLGYQTTGDGLVYRGRAADTVGIKSSGLNNAYFILDTVNNVLYNYINTKGGWKFSNGDTIIIQGVTMPFDSITFNTAKNGTVGVGEVEFNDTQGSLIQGLKGGNVTNVIGQQLHQRVNNRTGATLTKGTAVYLSGSQGNRITVAKALGVTDAFSANTFGIVAESIANNQSGYVITEGLITNINTSALLEDSAVYLSPTVAGGLTSTKPQAPQHTVYIGVCVKSNPGSGELFVKIRNGQELEELHNVRITSPVDRASLYYKLSEKLWRDTTAALLTSDTASMLTNYLRTGAAASTYLTQANAASTYLPLTGGTLTGGLTGTTGTFTSGIKAGNITSVGSPVLYAGISGIENEVHIYQGTGYENSPTTLRLTNNNSSFYQNGLFLKSIMDRGLNEYYAHLGIMNNNFITFRPNSTIGIFQSLPSYTLDVNGTFNASGNSLIGGTLGVTGATTLSNLSSASTTIVTASTTGLLSGISTLPIANGGTGATTQSTARTALGATVRGANTFILPDLGAISFLRYNADNTVSQRAADGMRTDLGGTTIGQSMFTLTNPSAITFPRFNADNTVSALDATAFRTAIGAGTGSGNGTVTSVTGTVPISVANSTTTPAITIANAGASTTGVVTSSTQTFGGAKTFNGTINAASELAVTGIANLNGGATIGTMATTSTLTHVLGVNSSNAIGEIGVADGIKFTSGFLGLDLYKVIALLDVPITGAQTSSDTPFTVTGAALGQPVILGVPNASSSANTNYTAWVSAANTVTIRFNNYSSISVNPPSGSFTIVVLNL